MAFETVLTQVPFFAQLSPSSLSDLSNQLHRRRYERDQTIFHKNDAGSALYIILSGKVKIILPSPEGENVIVALLSTGDFFGELSLFDNESRSASAVAAETAEMLTLDQPEFLHYITENPKVSISILAELSLRLRQKEKSIVSIQKGFIAILEPDLKEKSCAAAHADPLPVRVSHPRKTPNP